MNSTSRRDFLAAAIATGTIAASPARAAAPARLQGIFPILQTPFKESGALDTEALAREVAFANHIGVQGMTWPQLASEYQTLTPEERHSGAETIIAANKAAGSPNRPTVVIGCQAETAEEAARYASHADQAGADALIAIPLESGKDPARQMDYYAAIGGASAKPLFAQALGNMSVDFILEMSRKLPTLQYVKDEAGSTLPRLTEYRRHTQKLQGVFTGKHGPTFIDEMARGAIGNMPATAFAELYVATWKAWYGGKEDEAQDAFSHTLPLLIAAQTYGVAGQKYMLQLRGVFPNSKTRREPGTVLFDDEAKSAVKRALTHAKPWLKT